LAFWYFLFTSKKFPETEAKQMLLFASFSQPYGETEVRLLKPLAFFCFFFGAPKKNRFLMIFS